MKVNSLFSAFEHSTGLELEVGPCALYGGCPLLHMDGLNAENQISLDCIQANCMLFCPYIVLGRGIPSSVAVVSSIFSNKSPFGVIILIKLEGLRIDWIMLWFRLRDCEVAWGKFVICDISLYKLNWTNLTCTATIIFKISYSNNKYLTF